MGICNEISDYLPFTQIYTIFVSSVQNTCMPKLTEGYSFLATESLASRKAIMIEYEKLERLVLSCPSPHFLEQENEVQEVRDSCSRSQLTGGGAQTKTQKLFNSNTEIPFFLFGQQPGMLKLPRIPQSLVPATA